MHQSVLADKLQLKLIEYLLCIRYCADLVPRLITLVVDPLPVPVFQRGEVIQVIASFRIQTWVFHSRASTARQYTARPPHFLSSCCAVTTVSVPIPLPF